MTENVAAIVDIAALVVLAFSILGIAWCAYRPRRRQVSGNIHERLDLLIRQKKFRDEVRRRLGSDDQGLPSTMSRTQV